jgi:hypothetical protein
MQANIKKGNWKTTKSFFELKKLVVPGSARSVYLGTLFLNYAFSGSPSCKSVKDIFSVV